MLGPDRIMNCSLTALERNNPPSRRKSCSACIKAKRRCDFALPACLRCSQRNIACEYPKRGEMRATQRPANLPTTALPVAPVLAEATISPTWLTCLNAPHMQSDQSMGDTSIFDNLDTSYMGITDFSLPGCSIESSLMEVVGQNTSLAAPTTRDLHIEQVIAKRLQFAIDEIKMAPSSMILETQTPWCHPLLYQDGMPKSMQDAHASCALYLAKTRANAAVIFRAIDLRVRDLLCSPAPTTLVEILAHTQSLVLYQAIRLFDGDIQARASAERIIPDVEESAMRLLAHVRFDLESPAGDLPLYPLAPTKDFWTDWILQESARRTVLFCFFFLQAYRLVAGQKGLECDGRLGLCHSWTLSAHLWNAGTPVQFARAWRDKRHFVVTDAQFGEVLSEAEAGDVDRFGRMWISSLLGIEEAEGWFASKGGALRA